MSSVIGLKVPEEDNLIIELASSLDSSSAPCVSFPAAHEFGISHDRKVSLTEPPLDPRAYGKKVGEAERW